MLTTISGLNRTLRNVWSPKVVEQRAVYADLAKSRWTRDAAFLARRRRSLDATLSRFARVGSCFPWPGMDSRWKGTVFQRCE